MLPRGLRPWVQRSDSRFRGSPDDFSQIGGALADWTSTFLWVLILSAGCALLGILGALGLPKRSATPPTIALEPPTTQPLVAPSVFTVKPH